MSAKIIAVFNQKGGPGKTTVSIHIAGSAGLRGLRVLLVDMDRQATASKWVSMADENNPFPGSTINLAAMEGKMHKELRNHVEDYDLIVIDCPPAMHSAAPSSAMLIADLALIPSQPSPPDIWAAQEPKILVEQAKTTNESLIVRQVINLVEGRSLIEQTMIEAMREDEDIPFLKSVIKRRSAYRECALNGLTVHGLRAKPAIEEIETFVDEVFALIGIKKSLPKTKIKKSLAKTKPRNVEVTHV